MFILRLLIAALIVSYLIWLFNTRIMGKNIALSKIATWVLSATFVIFVVLSGLSYLVEGSYDFVESTKVFRCFVLLMILLVAFTIIDNLDTSHTGRSLI